jgi:protocadherin-15
LFSCSFKDINDNRPRFPVQEFNASIFENTPPGFSVIQLTATDDDSELLGTVYYNVSSVAGPTQLNGTFVIDPISGIVQTAGVFDREAFSGTYLVTVSYRTQK